MSGQSKRHTDDYIDRTIATIRNHQGADNCWPQWANIFADEIEDLRANLAVAERALFEIGREIHGHSDHPERIDYEEIFRIIQEALRKKPDTGQ